MKSIVCFLDVLGYRELVRKIYENKNEELIDDLEKIFNKIFEHQQGLGYSLGSSAKFEGNKLKEIIRDIHAHTRLNLLSDSLIVSLPIDKEKDDHLFRIVIFIHYISYLFLQFAGITHYFFRGAIVIEDHHEKFIGPNKNNLYIFSKALIHAYELENKEAKYVRVLIDESVASYFVNANNKDAKYEIILRFFKKMVIRDFENKWCLWPCHFFIGKSAARELAEGVRKALLFQIKNNNTDGYKLMKYYYFIMQHYNPAVKQHYSDLIINLQFTESSNEFVCE